MIQILLPQFSLETLCDSFSLSELRRRNNSNQRTHHIDPKKNPQEHGFSGHRSMELRRRGKDISKPFSKLPFQNLITNLFADKTTLFPRETPRALPIEELARVPRLRDRTRLPNENHRPVREMSNRLRVIRRILVKGRAPLDCT